jgi:hypothetical protein
MAPKYHPTPLSGGDRKALRKELTKARGVTLMLARQSDELRAKGEALIREADKLSCESWNERMWADGEPIDPSPTSTRHSMAAFRGSKSNAQDVGSSATSAWPNSRMSTRHASTTLPPACAASDARKAKSARWRHCCSWRPTTARHGGAVMQELTRRRTDDRFETWEIWYGDVQVGTIAQQDWDPNPERSGIWKWSCGFYPLHRDECFRGEARDFDTARAGFDAAWKVFLPRRTEAEFEACRRQKQWTANKYALWDAGYRNKLGRGPIQCACGAMFNPGIHEETMAHIEHITGRARR